MYIDGLPVTGVERTIMDCAALIPRWKVLGLIDSARRADKTSPVALRQCLAVHARRGRNGTVNFRKALELLHDDGPIPIGHLSRQAAQILVASGLPEPAFEVRIYDRFGEFVAQVDSFWPEGYVHMYDGFTYHRSRRETTNRDIEQRARLRELGLIVDEFSFDQINRQPEFLIATSRRNFSEARSRRTLETGPPQFRF